MTPKEVTQYEVAREIFNDLISWHTRAIWDEKQKNDPNPIMINRWERDLARYCDERRELKPADQQSAEKVINEYGKLVRRLGVGS